jgi:hypothetical protein
VTGWAGRVGAGKEEQLDEQHLVEDSIASAHINNATWTTNTTEQRFDNSA